MFPVISLFKNPCLQWLYQYIRLDVICRVFFGLLDWTPLTDWLPTKFYHTAYMCWFISLSSSGISGSVTSWLLPGSLPPTCRRLKNVRRYRSLRRSPITSAVGSEAVTGQPLSQAVSCSLDRWYLISNIICRAGVGLMNVTEPMAMYQS